MLTSPRGCNWQGSLNLCLEGVEKSRELSNNFNKTRCLRLSTIRIRTQDNIIGADSPANTTSIRMWFSFLLLPETKLQCSGSLLQVAEERECQQGKTWFCEIEVAFYNNVYPS